MTLENINPYNLAEFRKWFIDTNTYKQIKHDFDHVVFDKDFTLLKHQQDYIWTITPRHRISSPPTVFAATSFYYIKFLLDQSPKVIYDIGCGYNPFKKYIPNLVGIDSQAHNNVVFPDIDDSFNQEFVEKYKHTMETFFSICALHFIPLQDLKSQILAAASCLQPGGRAYIALNLARLAECDFTFFQSLGGRTGLDSWIRKELSDVPFEYLVFDLDIPPEEEWDKGLPDHAIDGNLRIVIQTKKD